MLVRELFFRLGFDATTATAQAKRFDRVIGGVKKRLASLPAVALAAATAAATLATKSADEYQGIQDSLGLVTNGAEELAKAQAENYRIAQETRSSYDATTGLFTALARPARRYGYELQDILQVTQNILKASKIGAKGNPASQQAALFQLQQGLESGTLRGEELNSVLEQFPRLADMIADGMRIPRENLREIAAQGKVTSQQIFDALLRQTEQIDAQFALVRKKGVDAWQQVKTAIFRAVGELSQSENFMEGVVAIFDQLRETIESDDFRTALKALITGFTALIGIVAMFTRVVITLLSWIQHAADKMGGWERVARVLASGLAAVALVMGGRMIAAAVAYIAQLGFMFTAQYAAAGAAGVLAAALNALPWVALITLLALVIEDLWQFANDNESITGNLLKYWSQYDNFFQGMIGSWIDLIQTCINNLIRLLNLIPGVDIGLAEMDIANIPKNLSAAGDWLSGQITGMTNWLPQMGIPGAGGLATRNLSQVNNARTTVNVTVPPGSSKEQAEYIGVRVREEMDQVNSRTYREALNNFPETE